MSTLEKWAPPLPDLDIFERRVRRLFHDLGVAQAITPAADVYEAATEVVIELDVPGFDEKDLTVEVTDHTLAISGKRGEEKESTEKTLRYRERLQSSFERRFQLPREADPDRIVAEYAKGVLTLHIPKLEERKRKLVKIEHG
jgi:HSP20 family protein